jgi:hypothetical protein
MSALFHCQTVWYLLAVGVGARKDLFGANEYPSMGALGKLAEQISNKMIKSTLNG